jgi:hypothetical protein
MMRIEMHESVQEIAIFIDNVMRETFCCGREIEEVLRSQGGNFLRNYHWLIRFIIE